VSRVAIQYLPDSSHNSAKLASRLGVPLHEIAIHRFPDGEISVTVGPTAFTTIIYASLNRPNDKLIEILLATEALRRRGCKRLVLLAPYLCYMRQDTAFHDGEAISQKAVGQLLEGLVDRIITVDAHLHRTRDIKTVFPRIAADNLSAMPVIAETLRNSGIEPRTIVVGPDSEALLWVKNLAARLGLDHAVASKSRRGDRSVEIEFDDLKLFAGRPILLADDIVSSGGTMMACARVLASAGAKSIDAVIIHTLFSPDLASELVNAGIRSIRSTYSVPHPTNAIPLDELFVAALSNELNGGSSITEPR
jgi:ribose-phosphate pyrophosphokinase